MLSIIISLNSSVTWVGSLTLVSYICTSVMSSMGVISDSLRVCVALQSASAFPFALPGRYLIVDLNNASSAAHLCSTAPSLAFGGGLVGCLCRSQIQILIGSF